MKLCIASFTVGLVELQLNTFLLKYKLDQGIIWKKFKANGTLMLFCQLLDLKSDGFKLVFMILLNLEIYFRILWFH